MRRLVPLHRAATVSATETAGPALLAGPATADSTTPGRPPVSPPQARSGSATRPPGAGTLRAAQRPAVAVTGLAVTGLWG